MPDIYLMIEGRRVDLRPNGESGSYEKYKEPDEYTELGIGRNPLIVSVYKKPGWLPEED